MLELAQDLIRIPSVNPALPGGTGEREVASYVDRLCAAAGFVRIAAAEDSERPNSVWLLPAPEGRPTLLLEAHTDTVTLANMPEGLQPVLVEGRLVGRGACDCKGPLAAMLAATEEFAKAPPEERPANVVLAAVCDEEVGQLGARALLDLALPIDGAIVAEPTRLEPVVAHNGVVRFQVEARGRSAHTAHPELGKNAILAMCDVVRWLEERAQARFSALAHPLCGHPLHTVAMIHGGEQYNLVPAACRIWIDRRTLPQEDPEEAIAWYRQELAELARRRSDLDVVLGPVDLVIPGLDTPTDHPVVQAAIEAARLYRAAAGPIGARYATNASTYWHEGRIPCVVLGPGDIAQAHTAEEWIALEELEAAVRVYVHAVRRFAELMG